MPLWTDATFGRPELADIRQLTRRADWPGLSAALASDFTGDDRSTAIAVATQAITLKGQRLRLRLEEWVRTEPHDPVAVLLLGAAEVERGWQARGHALAAHTTRAQFDSFARILERAELLCRSAAGLNPADPTPWEWLLKMARGQEVGRDETMDRHDRLVDVSPDHFMGHYQAICSLSPMWGHSVEGMFEQARVWSEPAPQGSLLPALTFVAYIEWVRRGWLDKRRFLGDPKVRGIAEEATEMLPMTPARRREEFWAHNYAAGWYTLVHDRKRASRHFAATRGFATPWPWGDLSVRPVVTYQTRRLTHR